MLKIFMALSEMEKRILQLRFNTESISNAKKIDYQEYRLSKKQIISKLAEEGHKVSMVEITNFLKSKLGFRKSFDYGVYEVLDEELSRCNHRLEYKVF